MILESELQIILDVNELLEALFHNLCQSIIFPEKPGGFRSLLGAKLEGLAGLH